MNRITLIGKPNSGKSSLFNLLTGLNQKVGNYAGVTVEKKTGNFEGYEIIDLPGLNSLWTNTVDEEISRAYIIKQLDHNNPVLFIANANQLHDNLILFSELADLQIPMILVINFIDELKKNNKTLAVNQLEDRLNCKVICMNSRTGEGLDTIKNSINSSDYRTPNSFCRSHYDSVAGDEVRNSYILNLEKNKSVLTEEDLAKMDTDFAHRQMLINNILNGVISTTDSLDKLQNRTRKIDNVLLHPFWGILIFLAVMLIVFQSVFTLSTYPMDWIDMLFAYLSESVDSNISIPWIADLIGNGVLPGLGGVLIFIPQIAILFFLLGVLENSGYLSRISNLSDGFLQKFGLSGKSIIPLMSSWACAIPAIMSARTIDDPKERLTLILVTPLMTCAARLPVYTILIAILIPASETGFLDMRGLALLGLYLIGIVATLIIALIYSKRSKLHTNNLWTLEMPLYRIPNWRNVFYNMYIKTKSFVVEAGKIIFLISIVLWFLASFSPKSQEFLDQKYNEYSQLEHASEISREAVELEYSYAGYMGKIIEPVIKPLGYDWKIGIALISSFAAREVFVGTLSTIYSVGSEDEEPIIQRLRNEVNIQTGKPQFNRATSISLLLFYVFALQCMSTLAIVKKETGQWKYAVFQFVAFTLLAYVAAFVSFQLLN